MGTLLDATLALSFSGWAIILSLSMLNYLFRFWRWQLYLNRWDYEIPVRLSIVYYFSGFALTTSPGKVGEAIRSIFLKRHGVEYRRSIAAVFVERYLDIVVIAVLATLSITLLDIGVLPIAITLGLAIATLPIIRSDSLRQRLKSADFHRKKGLVSQVVDRLVSLLEASSEIMSRRLLYVGFSIGLLGWISEGVALWVIFQYLSIDVQILPAIGIYAAASLVGAISFVPGGLGTTEAVMILLLTSAGADTPIAIAATIISRIATLWFAVVLGGICLFWASTNKSIGRPHDQS